MTKGRNLLKKRLLGKKRGKKLANTEITRKPCCEQNISSILDFTRILGCELNKTSIILKGAILLTRQRFHFTVNWHFAEK